MHYQKHVFICVNQKDSNKTCCANHGGEVFFDYLKKRLREIEKTVEYTIRISKSGCLGRCNLGPSIVIYPEGVWYSYTSFEDLDQILTSHLLQNTIVDRLLMRQHQ